MHVREIIGVGARRAGCSRRKDTKGRLGGEGGMLQRATYARLRVQLALWEERRGSECVGSPFFMYKGVCAEVGTGRCVKDGGTSCLAGRKGAFFFLFFLLFFCG